MQDIGLGGDVPPGSPNHDPISDPQKTADTRSQTWSLRNDVIIFYIRTETEIFLTIHFKLAYFSLLLFLLIWN